MKVLVTGGAGYIGSVVAGQLARAGHEVTVLDNFQTGHRDAVPPQARMVEADLLDREALASVLSDGVDAVLHFAALSIVSQSVEQPERYRQVNVAGTEALLAAMRSAGVGKLVFSSTAAVYGDPASVPIHEDAPTVPTSPYGETKLAVDRAIAAASDEGWLGAASLRYFNVAGASGLLGEDHRPETHLIPLVLEVALGQRTELAIYGTDYPTPDGTAIRDYIHVEDLARAHLLALGALEPGLHAVYNLGNGRGFSVREVVETARSVTGQEIPVRESGRRSGDPAVLVASSELIRSELGWEPEKPELERIVADAWEWRQRNPDGYRDTPK